MIELVEGKKHQVIKRDGRIDEYSNDKMYKVLLWAADGNEILARELLNAIELKVYDKISISKLFDEVVETCANLITDMFPIWDDVARNLFLQKIYKEMWGMRRNEYPYYGEVLKKGVQYGVYDREIVDTFSAQEVEELNSYLEPSRDKDLDYLGLRVFIDKQSKKYTPTKVLELPQHGFMRLALFAFWDEPKDIRMELIRDRYNDLSSLLYSEASPKWMNSLSYDPQMASCVVSKMPDTSWGINRTLSNLGLFSKHGGGLATDLSSLRSTNSKIGKAGKSSGPVPFVKLIESMVAAYNQNGSRPGALAAYFPWWHYDTPDLIELKEEGGTEDRRARKLQYGVKWNNLFTRRIIEERDITLFDPKETPELLETWGPEFEMWYAHYESKVGIKKKVISANELAFSIAKQRIETGNIYIFFEENVQNQNNFNDKIYSSNLCAEIMLSTKPVHQGKEVLTKDLSSGITKINEEYDPGLIALCNLSSINLMKWKELSAKRKAEMTYNLLRASDNLIDYGFYPAKEGEIFNRNYRAIGVGITNYAQFLASAGLKFSDKRALSETNAVMEDIYWYLMNASISLAEERGRFEYFNNTKYAKGIFTHEMYQGSYNYKTTKDWDGLRKRLLASGARFATVMAIAPTATSSLILKSTEGSEPVRKLVSMKTGTYSCKQLAPNIKTLRADYDIAWDIASSDMINLASVRQRWIDQSQSFSLYYKDRNDSAAEVLGDILMAEKEGVKSLYYAHSPKEDDELDEACESCSA